MYVCDRIQYSLVRRIVRAICNILDVGWKANRTKLYRELHRRPLIMVLNCFVGTYIESNEQFRIRSIDLSNKSSHRSVIEVATRILLSHHKRDLNLVNNPNFPQWISLSLRKSKNVHKDWMNFRYTLIKYLCIHGFYIFDRLYTFNSVKVCYFDISY